MFARRNDHTTGLALGAVGYLVISFESLGIRLAGLDQWNTAFWFGLFTAIAMTIVVPLRLGESFPAAIRHGGVKMLLSGTLQAASTISFILAIEFTTISNAAVIFAATPVLAAVVGHFFLHEPSDGRTWLAIAASISGIVVVVAGSLGDGRVLGDLFAVAAISAFTANLTMWRKYPELKRTVVIGLGGMIMALVSVALANPSEAAVRAVLILLLLGGFMGPLGRISVASATRYLPTAQVSLLGPVETLGAITWAWIFLNESPPRSTMIGGGIVLTAVLYGAAHGQRGMRVPIRPGERFRRLVR